MTTKYDTYRRQVDRRLAEVLEDKAVALFDSGTRSRQATRHRLQIIDAVDAIKRRPARKQKKTTKRA